jgi:alpha-1,2-mannosyltransferase
MRARRNDVVAIAILGLFLVPMLILMGVRRTPPVDLDVYLRAGRMFVTGGGLYGPNWGAPLAHPLPYTYPPVWAAIVAPIAWLHWRAVAVAWTILNLGLLLWIVRLSYRLVLDRADASRGIALAALVVAVAITTPLGSVFWFGQVGIVLAAACLADTIPTRTRLPRGVLVGFAMAVKLTPGIFMVYWLVTKRWRAAMTAATTALGLWLATAIVRPELSRQFWTDVVFRTGRVGDISFVSNQSIYGWLLRSGWSDALLWLTLVAVVLVVGMHRARVAHASGEELVAVTIVGITSLLVSPVSWIDHAVWIVPATGVLLGDARNVWRRAAWISLLGLFVLRLPDWAADGRLPISPGLTGVLENAYLWAYLLLLVFLPLRTPSREPYPVVESSAPA